MHQVYHCKLLQVTTTTSTRCKGQDQQQRKSERQQLATPTTPLPTSSGSAWTLLAGVHNTGIIATCIRAELERIQIVCLYIH